MAGLLLGKVASINRGIKAAHKKMFGNGLKRKNSLYLQTYPLLHFLFNLKYSVMTLILNVPS